jgi:antitoxin MazE
MPTRTRIRRWGHSLAVRIPAAYARELGLAEGDAVELAVEAGALVIRPTLDDAPTLEDLLASMGGKRGHGEVDWGPPCGAEEW